MRGRPPGPDGVFAVAMQRTHIGRFREPRARIALGLTLTLLVLVPAAGAAGDRRRPQAVRAPLVAPDLTEVEKVQLVLLPTVVTDGAGRPVRDLKVHEFRLLEDGIPQEIETLDREEHTPVSLVFLLDLSTSMGLRDQLGEAKRAIHTFVAALGPRDRFGLIGFADDQVAWIVPLTADRALFLRRLDAQQAGGQTALFDALGRSAGLVDEGTGDRRAIVLITDGFDNASTISMLEAIWMARQVRVPIYALGFVPMMPALLSQRVRDSQAMLGRFSGESGGRLFTIYEPADLTHAIGEIQAEMRFQYVVGYYSRRPVEDGVFRRVELETRNRRLTARTRAGYYPKP